MTLVPNMRHTDLKYFTGSLGQHSGENTDIYLLLYLMSHEIFGTPYYYPGGTSKINVFFNGFFK